MLTIEANFLLWETPVLLLRPPADWMRPTTNKGNLLCLKSMDYRFNHIDEIVLQQHLH